MSNDKKGGVIRERDFESNGAQEPEAKRPRTIRFTSSSSSSSARVSISVDPSSSSSSSSSSFAVPSAHASSSSLNTSNTPASSSNAFAVPSYSLSSSLSVASSSSSSLLDVGSSFYDYSSLVMKEDHVDRAMWVCPNFKVYLETFSESYREAYDFLVSVALPKYRLQLMNEFQISTYSIGTSDLSADVIIQNLELFSKNVVPEEVKSLVRESTNQREKLRLVVRDYRFYAETTSPDLYKRILRLASTRKDFPTFIDPPQPISSFSNPSSSSSSSSDGGSTVYYVAIKTEYLEEFRKFFHQDQNEKQKAKRPAPVAVATASTGGTSGSMIITIPRTINNNSRNRNDVSERLAFEYMYRDERENKNVPAYKNLDLKPSTSLRPHQEKSLSRIFQQQRARSGVVVLPCGAGKTLLGVVATCTVRQQTLVVCNTNLTVKQWKEQFLLFSNATDQMIVEFTSGSKSFNLREKIVITTYSMLDTALLGNQESETAQVFDEMKKIEWGLIVMDEVHSLPATNFRKIARSLYAHCILGLTATLLREDDKIEDLYYLVGPKLYEANWLDLKNAGYIADVRCAEVRCSVDPVFFNTYKNSIQEKFRATLIAALNPHKIRYCKFLADYHSERGDQIIVFCEQQAAIEVYSKELKADFIYGKTNAESREKILKKFRQGKIKVVCISAVGDVGIDLPDANVLIQISSQYGARRKEAQRLGRILRPKQNKLAYFYSLVSSDTREVSDSIKRSRFLVNQGFPYKIIPFIPECFSYPSQLLHTESELLGMSESLKADPDTIISTSSKGGRKRGGL